MRSKLVRVCLLLLFLPATYLGGAGANSEKPPFEVGESVRYEVNYKPLFLTPAFRAGELRLNLGLTDDGPKKNYRISAWVRSDGLLMSLAGLDVQDYLESTMDALSLTSLGFLHQVRTNRKQQDISVRIDRPAGRARVEILDVSSEPHRQIRSQTFDDIPQDISDYLSAFYRLRAGSLEVGQELQLNLSENGKLNKLTVRVEKEEKVKTPLGPYRARLVSTQGGLFRGGGELRVWFSVDKYRVPVKFEADVRFGKVYGHLIELQTSQMTKTLIHTQ